MQGNFLIAVFFILQSASTVLGETPEPHSTMRAAIAALKSAKNENEKSTILAEIGHLHLESPDQLVELYDEVAGLERKVTDVDPANQRKYVENTRILSRVLGTAESVQFSDALATVLEKEYRSMPTDFVGAQGAGPKRDLVRNQMRQLRLQALVDIAGKTRNRKALSTLRKMLDRRGVPRQLAVGAIGQIGDPSDIEDFIRRIKRDPKSHITLNSFGPAAVDPIIREVEDPSVSEQAKYTMAVSLEYMATHENLDKYRHLLKHKDQVIREMTAKAVCRIAQSGDGDALIEIAEDSTNMYQLQAVDTMRRVWNPKFSPILRKLLNSDPDQIVRAHSARILGIHNVRDARSDLEKAQNDRQGEVRRAASAALKDMQ